MPTILLISLFLFGLLFGSFATVLITRWHSHESGIFLGRSKCPKCHHTLRWYELFPIASYFFLGGKCKKCREKIPVFYPFAEILMGSVFIFLSFAYLKNTGYLFDIGHILILSLGFVTGVYILSDILYMEIPDQIMVPGIYGYLILMILGFFSDNVSSIFFERSTYIGGYADFVGDHLMGAIILYTFLYLQILIPATWQLGKMKRWKDVGEIIISYFTFPFLLLAPEKEKKDDDTLEIETWVGGGDLRIALFIGITLGTVHGITAFFIAYMLGSFIGIIILILKGLRKTHIPFGPFLGIGWCTALFYYPEILSLFELYKSLF